MEIAGDGQELIGMVWAPSLRFMSLAITWIHDQKNIEGHLVFQPVSVMGLTAPPKLPHRDV